MNENDKQEEQQESKPEWQQAGERQHAKKPYIQSDGHGKTEVDCYECPTCDSFLGHKADCEDACYRDNYCRCCGQAIDWDRRQEDENNT